MATFTTYPHVVLDDQGTAHLTSCPRFRLALFISITQSNGWSPEEIQEHYPELSLGCIYGALGYYFDHKQLVDAEIQADEVEWLRIEQLPRTEFEMILRNRKQQQLGKS